MKRDVAAEDLGEDPPVLQQSIQHLVKCPYSSLHCPLFLRIYHVLLKFYLVRLAEVPVVGLGPLTRVKEVPQNLVENSISVYSLAM